MTDTAESGLKRGPGRPPLRDSNRTSLRDRLRAKAPKSVDMTNTDDKFAIPGAEKHEGVSFQWKRHTIKGQEDPGYMTTLRRGGWEPMTAEDFPELAAEGETGSIIREGMILMGRPKELTEQAEGILNARAKKQIHDQKVQVGLAPSGTLQRVNSDMRGNRLGIQTEVMRQINVED